MSVTTSFYIQRSTHLLFLDDSVQKPVAVGSKASCRLILYSELDCTVHYGCWESNGEISLLQGFMWTCPSSFSQLSFLLSDFRLFTHATRHRYLRKAVSLKGRKSVRLENVRVWGGVVDVKLESHPTTSLPKSNQTTKQTAKSKLTQFSWEKKKNCIPRMKSPNYHESLRVTTVGNSAVGTPTNLYAWLPWKVRGRNPGTGSRGSRYQY